VLREQGRHKAGRSGRVRAIQEKAYGSDHPTLAITPIISLTTGAAVRRAEEL
jgi:hypothetical protein